MKVFRILLTIAALSNSGICAQESAKNFPSEVTTSSEMVTIASETATVPEPSSAFFAGIGGLALLFFVLRRRTSATY